MAEEKKTRGPKKSQNTDAAEPKTPEVSESEPMEEVEISNGEAVQSGVTPDEPENSEDSTSVPVDEHGSAGSDLPVVAVGDDDGLDTSAASDNSDADDSSLAPSLAVDVSETDLSPVESSTNSVSDRIEHLRKNIDEHVNDFAKSGEAKFMELYQEAIEELRLLMNLL